jgi:hypothetical protein
VGRRAFESEPYFRGRKTRPERTRDDNRFAYVWAWIFERDRTSPCRRAWNQDAKRRLAIDAEGKEGKRVASFGTLGLIAKGENEGLENRVEHFDRLSTDDRRVLDVICQDKKRDEQVTPDNTEQDKSGCEPEIDSGGR